MNNRSQDIEGLGLEFLEKLTLFDHEFEYDRKIYNYRDIKHIEYTAVTTKHSINFIPTGTSYDANLFLHFGNKVRLQIKQERVFLKFNEKERSEAIMQAAAIFMDITFNQRVDAYESQIKKKGFINWGKHQIGQNGDLFRNNEFRFNLLGDDIICNLGPFQVECRKRKPGIGERLKELWSGAAEIIDISSDKDCFIYVMKRYLGLSWQGQPVREKQKTGPEIFNEAILILGAKLCKADGHVSPEEIVVFKRYFGIDENSHPEAGKIFMEAAKTSDDAKQTAGRIFGLLNEKREPLEYILIGLMQIATADGHFHESERIFIRMVATEFAFSSTDIHRLFLIFEHTQEHSSKKREAPAGAHATSLREQHLEVLGLNASATFVEIKASYRDLARKHHPDILRSQGVPVDDISSAEEMLKVINSAYEWLTRYHQNEAERTN